MIVVTGTKRSGTSMWMQILDAAGVPWIGQRFPRNWEESLVEANRRGFFESALREGVWYATNPDPNTGRFLHPAVTRGHACKIFMPGVVRTDFAFLDRVLATVRSWREYGPSVARLEGLEDRWLTARALEREVDFDASARRPRAPLAPSTEWFFAVFEFLRDAATRGYPFHVVSYDAVLREPTAQIARALEWLGVEPTDASSAVVDRALRTQDRTTDGSVHAVPRERADLYDELYECIDAGRPLASAFIGELNAAYQALRDEVASLRERDALGLEP